MVKVGVIGCGHWGLNHIRILKSSKNVLLKSCSDLDQKRLDVISNFGSQLRLTNDYREILRDNDIDAVIISTPTTTHYKIVREAIKRGKHVLCEKPLTVKKEESKDLVELANKFNKILMVGYVFLYNNGVLALKEEINGGKLGKIHYLHFTRTNLGPIRDDVDVIYDLASHDISIAAFLLDSFPIKVSASAGYFLRKKICDVAFLTLYFPKNVLANIHVSWLDPKKVRQITCIADKKMALWDDLNPNEPIRIFNKGVVKEPYYSDFGEFHLLPREGEVVSPLVRLNEPLKNEINVFLSAVENNKTPYSDALFGHKISKILEGVQISLKNGGKAQEIV